MKQTDMAISVTFSATETNLMERHLKMRRLAKEKVTMFAKYLGKNAPALGLEGLEIVMPYVVELFEDAATGVQAAWSLFNPMAQALGPKKTAKFFLPLLTSIFDDESTTPKHMKLYHRSYIIQLIVRLGMECFLNSFSTLLVEASAGYKNFMGDDFDRQISTDADLLEEEAQQFQDVFMEGVKEELFTSSDEQERSGGSGRGQQVQGEDEHEDIFPGGMDGVGEEEAAEEQRVEQEEDEEDEDSQYEVFWSVFHACENAVDLQKSMDLTNFIFFSFKIPQVC